MSASDHAITAPATEGSLVARLDQLIGTVLELVTAALVAVEIVILFVGIVARYVFHSPLIWSDELASMLCLWLAMLGGALALRRKEHMRMSAFATRAPPHLRPFFDNLALFAFLGFLLALLRPAIAYVDNESIVSLMSLDISMSWRASAMPVGVGLMIVTALLRIDPHEKPAAFAAAAVVVVCSAPSGCCTRCSRPWPPEPADLLPRRGRRDGVRRRADRRRRSACPRSAISR